VKALAYVFVPYLAFFVSILMFMRWWTALIEVGALAVIGWKFAGYYDQHHHPRPFDDRLDTIGTDEAIEKYMRTYPVRAVEE